ncbi:C1QL [Mytilus coruscus]|uniref:C1QL n=1 Tax=Mytilus coruscus TaxID=42192 RepID=A0A6J8B8P6_MYTCO|nr:C1QL [Mytilus coruscus]
MKFGNAIVVAILTSILTSGGSFHQSCSRNASLMKSIQYQLKLVEANDEKCDCNHSPSSQSKFWKGWFFWYLFSGSLQNVGKDAIVVYNTVTTNLGGGYDKSTGVFTAPVEGLFFFAWTVLAIKGKNFYTHLNLNDILVAKTHAGAGIYTQMASSQSAVYRCRKMTKCLSEFIA